MVLVSDMAFITMGVALILEMVTTPSLLMQVLSQALIAVEACF
jgi:hypothetical protein